jgi:hypothetical protein
MTQGQSSEDVVRLQFVRALDAWVKVEHRLAMLFYILLKPMAFPKSQILFESMNGFQAQREAVDVLVQDSISDAPMLDEFSRLVDRLRGLASKRNRLVHGRWMNARVTEGGPVALARLYVPPNLKVAVAGKTLATSKGKFIFFLDDLRRAEAEFEALASDLERFSVPLAAKLGVSPYVEIPAEDIHELRVEPSPPSDQSPGGQ